MKPLKYGELTIEQQNEVCDIRNLASAAQEQLHRLVESLNPEERGFLLDALINLTDADETLADYLNWK